jgi:hypothetical protein
MTERFPERPWFKEWRKEKNLGSLCWTVLREGTSWNWRQEQLVVEPKEQAKVEALYEFCAASGRLAVFESAWQDTENSKRVREEFD